MFACEIRRSGGDLTLRCCERIAGSPRRLAAIGSLGSLCLLCGCATGRLAAFDDATTALDQTVVSQTPALTSADIPRSAPGAESLPAAPPRAEPLIVPGQPAPRHAAGRSAPPWSPRMVQHARPAHPPSPGQAPFPGQGPSWGADSPRGPHFGRPIIVPQIYGFPPQAPGPADSIPPPATLSGEIEPVPVIVPLERSRSRATYQVVPLDPPSQTAPPVDTQSPVLRPGYFELPPPQ